MSCGLAISPGGVLLREAGQYAPKNVCVIDPLEDPRWGRFVARHPRASVFHSGAWLQALSETYGYKAVVYTTTPATEELRNGMIFCRVESWLTGHRLVSLPFADHCEPLLETKGDLKALAIILEETVRRGRCRYVEVRPVQAFPLATTLRKTTVPYFFHNIDLRPDLNTLFRNFHKDSTQRKIRRAYREGLWYEIGSTEALLDAFYGLLKMTRRRHKLPPQPRKWFRNLMRCFGEALKIRIAFQNDRPVAGMLTLSSKDTLVYKYGCSDARFNNLGGIHLLFWQAIQEAKKAGLKTVDLGRMNTDQPGLAIFKRRWGATESTLTYSRYAVEDSATHLLDLSTSVRKLGAAKQVLALLQPGLVSILGRALYKHVG